MFDTRGHVVAGSKRSASGLILQNPNATSQQPQHQNQNQHQHHYQPLLQYADGEPTHRSILAGCTNTQSDHECIDPRKLLCGTCNEPVLTHTDHGHHPSDQHHFSFPSDLSASGEICDGFLLHDPCSALPCTVPCDGDTDCDADDACDDPNCDGAPCFEPDCADAECTKTSCPDNQCATQPCHFDVCRDGGFSQGADFCSLNHAAAWMDPSQCYNLLSHDFNSLNHHGYLHPPSTDCCSSTHGVSQPGTPCQEAARFRSGFCNAAAHSHLHRGHQNQYVSISHQGNQPILGRPVNSCNLDSHSRCHGFLPTNFNVCMPHRPSLLRDSSCASTATDPLALDAASVLASALQSPVDSSMHFQSSMWSNQYPAYNEAEKDGLLTLLRCGSGLSNAATGTDMVQSRQSTSATPALTASHESTSPASTSPLFSPRSTESTSSNNTVQALDGEATAESKPEAKELFQCYWNMADHYEKEISACGVVCKTAEELHTHIKIQHTEKLKAQKKFICRWVGCKNGKDFDQCSKLNRHMQTHANHKPHVCPYPGCGKRFVTAQTRDNHYRTHDNLKPFKCKYCTFIATTKTQVTTHENAMHIQNKKFKCHYCSFSCTDSSNLSKHEKIHREKTFTCLHPGCSFKPDCRWENVKRHFQSSGHCSELLTDPVAQKRYKDSCIELANRAKEAKRVKASHYSASVTPSPAVAEDVSASAISPTPVPVAPKPMPTPQQ